MRKRKNLISAQIIADSIHALSGKRLTTLIVTLPRIVLAEFNTHRVFGRNSGSSRAITYMRMRASVINNLFIPLAFQKHHKGMQGTDYHKFGSIREKLLILAWVFASKLALFSSLIFYKLGATKQLANRLLEPFMWHTIIVTSTEWENFFNQRCPRYGLSEARSWEDYIEKWYSKEVGDELRDYNLMQRLSVNNGAAEIHISLAAEAIYTVMKNSVPTVIQEGEWHIPFREHIEKCYGNVYSVEDLVKMSTALCAMVSFTEVGGKTLFEKIDYQKNVSLHDRLIEDDHMSPTEHCSQVKKKLGPYEHSNLKGNWLQYRKVVEKKKYHESV